MSSLSLPEILNLLQDSADLSSRTSADWTQGRAAFGGLVGALATLGMARALPARTPLRSLMASFVAPLPPGPVRVQPAVLRQGRSVTHVSASVIAEDTICLSALGVFGEARPGRAVQPDPGFAPEPRHPWADIHGAPRALPAFLSHFEGFWTGGGVPFSGRCDLRLGMWVRHRDDMSAFPVERLVSIADIPPPVLLSHYNTPPVPASSVTWSLEFVRDPAHIDTEWFYLDYRIDHAQDGYTQQSGKVFTEDGLLCALSRQCMVYFDQPRDESV